MAQPIGDLDGKLPQVAADTSASDPVATPAAPDHKKRRSNSLRGQFLAMTVSARLLVINNFGINFGFFLVLPYLATYLTDNLGYGATIVGVVLGIRTLSQQGLSLLGGTVADRIGARPAIIIGCGLRVVGFGLLAIVTSLPGLMIATITMGIAGATFTPAVRSYLTHEAGKRRAEVFSVFNVAANAGTLAGPLVGALLITVDFRLLCTVSAGIFAVLTIAQLFALPPRPIPKAEQGVFRSWLMVFRNRRFIAFAIFGAGYFALFTQLYQLIPLEAQRVSGWKASVSAVFVISTLIGIASQVRITLFCQRRWSSGTSLAVGLALMGLSFVPLLISAPLLGEGGGALPLLPVLLTTVLLTIGSSIANPFTMELVPVIGGMKLLGTYFGVSAMFSAVLTSLVSSGTGWLSDIPGAGWRMAPAATLLLVGLICGFGILMLDRRGLLGPRRTGQA